MTTLDGAVALAQSHVVAEIVGEDLHLDVTRTKHELLQVNAVVAERRARLGARGLVLRLEVGGVVHLAHALSAAARRGLDKHGVTDGLGKLARLLDRVEAAVGTGNGGDAARLHGLAGGTLVAHALDTFGGRADEHDVVIGARTSEVGVLGEEAVAGVDGLGAACFSPPR